MARRVSCVRGSMRSRRARARTSDLFFTHSIAFRDEVTSSLLRCGRAECAPRTMNARLPVSFAGAMLCSVSLLAAAASPAQSAAALPHIFLLYVDDW